ncbi:MAG: stage VI sporulation protein F [Bacilli bacterium]|nr:stage VI sporulation protein F [Acholeplasmataceae bacterium]MDY2902870.1 stage VI sporulation protein F [Bacilli bacterium]
MNFGNILNFIAENNIEPEQVFALVEKIKNTDLSDEKNIRDIIHDVSLISGKSIDKSKEDILVKKIMQNGINEDLLNLL